MTDQGSAPADDTPQFVRDRRTRQLGTHRAFRAVTAQHATDRSALEVFADQLTAIASSAPFLALHIAWFALWIAWNVGLFRRPAFDPFPFGLLTMIVSLEAIFLSIFVLMAQNRESAVGELREEITLQVNLRIEEEVTKTLQLVAGLYKRLGHQLGEDAALREMLRPLDAEEIERDLVRQIEEVRQARRPHSEEHAAAPDSARRRAKDRTPG